MAENRTNCIRKMKVIVYIKAEVILVHPLKSSAELLKNKVILVNSKNWAWGGDCSFLLYSTALWIVASAKQSLATSSDLKLALSSEQPLTKLHSKWKM